MVRILHFIQKPELRKYDIQNIKFELEVNEHIFPPSIHGSFFAENMKINVGESVIDIGTGSGFLGILAAKLGGKVSATEVDNHSIELAKKNATRNNVSIDFQQGEYFANFKKKFDVLLVNLPQEIVHRDYLKAIGEQLSTTIYAGESGNEQLVDFLKIAKNHMTTKSRIYTFLYTLSDYKKTLKIMLDNFNVRILDFETSPTREFVEEKIDFYLKLNKIGKIKIFKIGEKWYAEAYLLELTLK